MRELAFGERKTGRSTTLMLTMIEEMSMHDKPVYIIAGRFCIANEIKNRVRQYNEDSRRVHVIALESLGHFLFRDIDPMDVYIEHTAYEMATANQLKMLYSLEDRKYGALFG